MTGVSRSGASPLSESYAYGPNDRRIRKNGTDYLYDSSQIHAEYTNGWSDPSAVTSHGPGIDRPLIRAGLSGGVFNQAGYYHADLLGSVLAYSGAAVPIVNLAREPGSTITATNTWANQPASLLVDGTLVDSSQPEVWIANTPSDIDVTFAQSHMVNRVVLHTSNFFNPAVYRPSDLTVYAKDSQDQWQQQAQVNGNTDQIIDIGFNAVETTAIRVRISAPASGNVTLATELEIYNASGSAVTQRFDAWGNVTASSGGIPHYGYTGREPDDSGLIYYRARYYDPRIGRFTQRDPLGFIDGVNRYVYVANTPVNAIDPSGEFLNFIGGAVANVVVGGIVRKATGGDFFDAGGIATDLAIGAATSGAGALASLRHLNKIKNAAKSGKVFNSGGLVGKAQVTGTKAAPNYDHATRSIFEGQKLVKSQGGTAHLDASVKNLGITGTARNYRPDVLHRAANGRINTVEVASVSQQSGNARRYLDVKTADIRNVVTGRGDSFSGKVIEYGDARVGMGEVYDAFYRGRVNSALAGYQGLNAATASQSASAAPYSGTNAGAIRPPK